MILLEGTIGKDSRIYNCKNYVNEKKFPLWEVPGTVLVVGS